MSWWGKIAGGAFGFMLGGPLGALIGATIGHQFDTGVNALDERVWVPGTRTNSIFYSNVLGHGACCQG
jgi:DnaJ like chaperone protein